MRLFLRDFLDFFVGSMVLLFVLVVLMTFSVTLIIWQLPMLEDAITWGLLIFRCSVAFSVLVAVACAWDDVIKRG